MDGLVWLLLIGLVIVIWQHQRRVTRDKVIARFAPHPSVLSKFRQLHPNLSLAQERQVIDGLRQYFRLCLRAQRRMVSMPSQVVDDLWHQLILHTRVYEQFCQQAFGRFLHHTPAEAMSSPTQAQTGIRRAWYLACKDERMHPKRAARLPLLFALDASLNIANGFYYQLHCDPATTSGYCASSIGCGGGSDGCGGDSGGDSDGGGDGGCGGGCGGD